MVQNIQINKKDNSLQTLLDRVHERHLHPENPMEIAAIVESFGWTDRRVQDVFGMNDVFELASELWRISNQGIQSTANDYSLSESSSSSFLSFTRQFIRGTIFALPMVLSIAAMLFLHFSLWSYLNLSTETATAIAMGTILSFITVGGFMQAIARRGFFYLYLGYYRMAGRITFRFIRVGIYFSFALSLVILILDVIFPVLPLHMIFITVMFYLVLNSIWLSVTAMYILQRELVFTGLLIIGILLVYVGFRILNLNILLAQLISMTVISVAGLIVIVYFFRSAESKNERGINPRLPRTSVTIYSVFPYFIYGFLYFLLLFADRIIAWTTQEGFIPLEIWFRGDYEVALDLALITLVIPMGVTEVIVTKLMLQATASQRQFGLSGVGEMGRVFLQGYRRSVIIMFFLSISSSIGVYVGVRFYLLPYVGEILHEDIITPNTLYMLVIALCSYTIISMGLLNAVVMFSLSRPDGVLRPLVLAVAADIFIGFLLSRWLGYPNAVWGLLGGCFVFSSLTFLNIQKIIRHMDYHLYLLS